MSEFFYWHWSKNSVQAQRHHKSDDCCRNIRIEDYDVDVDRLEEPDFANVSFSDEEEDDQNDCIS